MKNFKNFVSSNKTQIAVVIVALLTAICVCIGAVKFAGSNFTNNASEVAETNQLQSKTDLTADATVQSGTVTVNYLDTEGNNLLTPLVKTGNVGEEYEVTRPDITRYVKYGEEPITRAGVYEIGNVEVNFYYRLASKEILTRTDQKGENGAEENQVNLIVNNPKVQRDYKLKIVTKDENGEVINGAEFEVGKAGDTLRTGKVRNGCFYVGKIAIDEEGKSIYEIEETSAAVGYKKIDGEFELGINSTWNSEKNKFEITLDNIEKAGVTASVNENDEIIVELINKKYKDMYEVELIYKTNTELISGGKFKVTKDSNVLVNDYTENGFLKVGDVEITENGKDKYLVSEEETAEGYTRVIEQGNTGVVEVTKTFNNTTEKYDISVTFSNIPGFSAVVEDGNKVVIYVEADYADDKYDLCVKKFVSKIDGVDTENREPVVTIEEGKVKYSQNEEIEKAANEQEITYILRTYNESKNDGQGKRLIEYIPDGLVFLPENEINKTTYEWKMYKEDNDGDLIEVKSAEEATVVATDYLTDKEIKGFDIDNDELPNYEDVEVVFVVDESKIKREDRIIENKVKIESNPLDENEENDESTEKVYIKVFDLDLVKFTEEVKVKNSIKETVQHIGEEQKGKLVKVDVAKDEVENTTITVTYGIRVKNIGEIAGYATQVVDYIPADFEIKNDGTWKVDGNKAITTKLENKLLQPGESTVIYITFSWKLSNDNISPKINEAKITKYENEYNAKDPTEDNNDNEEMIVTVRTGSAWVFITIAALVGFWTIFGIVLVLKKRK